MMLAILAVSAGIVIAVQRDREMRRRHRFRRQMIWIFGSWEAYLLTQGVLVA